MVIFQDAGHAAAGGHQQGDEALAGQAELAEDAVHDEGDAGHVAHVLHEGQQEAEHQDLGHEAQHRAHAGHDAVHDQGVQPLGDHRRALGVEQEGVEEIGDPLAEEHVVGPVGAHGADGDGVAAHGDGVHREHDDREDGQGQHPVGDDAVDLVGDGEAAVGGLLLHGLPHHRADVGVALVGDDALRVVVQLFFTVGDVLLQVLLQPAGQVQLGKHLLVPLKDLDGEPPQVLFVHQGGDGLLDVGHRVLHAAGEHVGQLPGLAGLGGLHRQQGGVHAALPLEGGDLHHLAAQGVPQLFAVDLVAVFPHQVHHVHGHHHRDAQLNELGGEVQVALDVGAVHDVQDGVGLLLHQVVPGHHFLQGVGGQGIDAGQVLDDDFLIALQPSLLLFHRDAGPVAHVLVGAGQGVEQRGLAAVRIARQRDLQLHGSLFLSLELASTNLQVQAYPF